MSRALRRALVLALAALAPAAGARAELPPEGECPTIAGAADAGAEDAGAVTIHEGMVITQADLLALRKLFPPELWTLRDTFFYEGMRLVVGPCHKRYAIADFFLDATRRHAGEARLDDDGNLRDYRAGLPFPPDAIDPEAPDAGARWAWNLEMRYRGAGPIGRFRLVDMPGRVGSPQTYEGDFFLVMTGHRADLAASGYDAESGDDNVWVAGGRFDEPFDARHLAWRQLRPEKALRRYKEPDHTFVYVPTMRKPRRAATPWSDGIFTPRYTVSGDSSGGAVPYAQGQTLGAINPTGGESAAASEDIRRGFTGLALRPNAYDWTLRGELDVLAPLNVTGTGYPLREDRNWGPSGLSIASDTWDLRRAVVIEGVLRVGAFDWSFLTAYVDRQTQQPLYVITRRRNRLIHEVGVLAHRHSGGRFDYPLFPYGGPDGGENGSREALVFDPVAALFYSSNDGGTGWRRESYGVRSVPVSEAELRDLTSTIPLSRGR